MHIGLAMDRGHAEEQHAHDGKSSDGEMQDFDADKDDLTFRTCLVVDSRRLGIRRTVLSSDYAVQVDGRWFIHIVKKNYAIMNILGSLCRGVQRHDIFRVKSRTSIAALLESARVNRIMQLCDFPCGDTARPGRMWKHKKYHRKRYTLPDVIDVAVPDLRGVGGIDMLMLSKIPRARECPWVELRMDNLMFMAQVVAAQFSEDIIRYPRKKQTAADDWQVDKDAVEGVYTDDDNDGVEEELGGGDDRNEDADQVDNDSEQEQI